MATLSVERRLAAILCADVVGYSRLMGADEEGTLRALHTCRALIYELIADHHGRVFGSAGDSVLAEFPSAVEAVRCAIEIQDGIEQEQAALPEDRRMRLRIGINLGDVMIDGADLQGDGVNIAARLEALAEPGSIYLSGTAFDHVEGRLDQPFEFLGERTVKNIARPVRVYRLDPGELSGKTGAVAGWPVRLPWHWAALLAVALAFLAGDALFWQTWLGWPTVEEVTFEPEPALPLPDKPSLAVLPFANMSGDAAQEYFSDGMTENLITNLSKLSGLFVIARNSTFTYKGRAVNVQDVGRELGVHYVLEGSVQRAADRVRITAQLIDATTGFHLWAEQFDREIADIFALQDEVAGKIVEALEVRLTERERENLARRYTESLAAYDTYLRGWESYWRFSLASTLQARRYFEQAIGLDPGFALAYANLAITYTGLGGNLIVITDLSGERAFELAQRAVALDPSLPQAHFALAKAHELRGEYDQAIGSVERVLELDPNYADAYVLLGNVLTSSGRPEEALEAIQRGMRLNPRFPSSYFNVLGQAKFLLRQYDEAIEAFEQALARNPNATVAHIYLAASYAYQDQLAEATWHVDELLTLDPQFTLDRIEEVVPHTVLLEHLRDGLRKAGLPD